MFRSFAEWLSTTNLSQMLQNALWVVPTSQSIHIICVSIVFASTTMINLRLLGVGVAGRSISQLSSTLLPWVWVALGGLLLTGTVQTIAEPVRQFVTPAFWSKMAMILLVVAATVVFVRSVRSNAARWDAAATRPASARFFAVGSTLLWIAIIACGRFIGYTWTFYY